MQWKVEHNGMEFDAVPYLHSVTTGKRMDKYMGHGITRTHLTFGRPYRRVYWDAINVCHFVFSGGVKVPVRLRLVLQS